MPTFASSKTTMPCGVMVARRILVPPVRVRIFPRQHQNGSSFELPFFFVVPVGPHELFGLPFDMTITKEFGTFVWWPNRNLGLSGN